MRIDGEWYRCDDGVTRPVVRGEIQAGDGSWVPVEFLVDTGADRTVLAAAVAAALGPTANAGPLLVGGLGGVSATNLMSATIRLHSVPTGPITIPGTYPAVTSHEALDMSVLGRDILNIFSLIVDWPGNLVCMVRPNHRYRIEAA